MATAKVPCSQAIHLHVAEITPTTVSLAWQAPAVGTPPIYFTVFYRATSASAWVIGALVATPSAVVRGLRPSTEYAFEVLSHNW